MVGALFILILLVVAFSFSLVMFNSFTGYQNAVDTRAQYNSLLPREQLSYNRVIFGASTAYSPTNTFAPNMNSAPGAEFFPVSNMNFTSSSAGWVFTRSYAVGSSADIGMSGNFDPVTSVGSSSGPGEIYTDLINNQGASTTITATGTWTTQFTLTSAQISSLEATCAFTTPPVSSCSTMEFSLGYILWVNIKGISGYPQISFIIQDANNPSNEVTIASPSPSSNAWTSSRYYFSSYTAQKNFFTGSSGTYNLIVQTVMSVGGQNGQLSEQKVYFDDTGVELSLVNFYYSPAPPPPEGCALFAISQNPLSVQDLTISVTTTYTTPVTQTIYFWDYAQSSFTQVNLASIGTTTVTTFVDLGGLLGGASEVQSFIQASSNQVVTPSGCGSISTYPTTASPNLYSIIMKVYSVETTPGASYTWTMSASVLTAFYSNSAQFSVELTNSGTSAMHLVSLWIIGSTGPVHYASTLAAPYYFSEWVAPGQTVSFTVAYSWTAGQYTLELVTSLGNIFTDSVTAT